MDAKERVRALEDVGIMGPPLGGSFRQLEELTGVTAAGYNEPSDDGGDARSDRRDLRE